MRSVIIIQARMASRRLPGKVLLDLAGEPMVLRQVERLRQCQAADDIVIATTTNTADDALVNVARRAKIFAFRGDENDVLGRYVAAAQTVRADVVVRVTADCPLVDPEITDRVIRELLDHPHDCDYASNVMKRTYPRGLDVEVLWRDTLLRCDRMSTSRLAREHVTLAMRSEHPERFLVRSVVDEENHADLRWTVDTLDDLGLVRRIYEELGLAGRVVAYREIVAHVRRRPELAALNAGGYTWTP